jgi:23S rRNA pseudouridine1911/1915/1917 synthase
MSGETVKVSLKVNADLAGKRLDAGLAELLERELGELFSRSKASRLIEEGRVFLRGAVAQRASITLLVGETIEVNMPPASNELALVPDSSVTFDILFEDTDVLVLSKPAGIVVHPGAGQPFGTLANGIVALLGSGIQQIGNALRPGIVHRLDKDTSGVMVVAKSEFALRSLQRQFRPPRSISRIYLALVHAVPWKSPQARSRDDTAGQISLALARDKKDRKRMAAREDGREAVTHWTLREKFTHGALLELKLETGRTHQIRAHLEAVGSPIVGDPVYRRNAGALPSELAVKAKRFARQALHAWRLDFTHPRSGERLSFEAVLPEDFKKLLEAFRRDN